MSNNWNDPNAPQGGDGGADQNWNQAGSADQPWTDPAQGSQPSADSSWDQSQASANQGWDANAGQQAGGWDQSQASANQGWDANAGQQAGGWDPNAGQQGYNPGPAGGAGYGAPGYGAPPMAPGANIGPLGMPLASFGKRAYGWLFDFLLPGFVISFIVSLIFRPEVTSTSGGVTISQSNNIPSIIGSLLLYLALSYVSAKTGQTWGRKIAKTQLVGEDGQPIGLGKSFIRYIAHYVDSIICMIGWLFPIWDSKRQTLADKIMKTYVLDVSQSGPINVQQ
ncbi:RDD family protein [Propionibacteriaceae bacterium Y1923]